MKTILITEKQKKKIKKAIAAQDQVGGKVNAGIMDAAAYGGGGMCEEKEPIKEAAVDLEYHYTSLRNLISMMKTDTFNLSDNRDKDLKEPGRLGDYFMSLTRMRSSAEGYGHGMIIGGESPLIRIELDGRKLNNIRNVNVRPYDFIYNNWENLDMSMEPGAKRKSGRVDGGDTAEAEDSLTFKDGKDQIVDASEYINRIDILLYDRVNDIKIWEKFIDAFDIYKDWADKMHFFVNLNDFNYQRNEINRSKIYSMYIEQAKQALGENVEQEALWNGEGDEFEFIRPTTIPKVLYHASYRKNRESILNNGLLPSAGEEYSGWWDYSGPNGEQPDGIDELPELVFLSADPYGWARHYYLECMDIYAVDITKLDTDCLYKDPTKGMSDCYCYDGVIPPNALKLYDFVYRGKSRAIDDPEFESVKERFFNLEENVEDDEYTLGAEKGMSPYYHVNESMEDIIEIMEDEDYSDYNLLSEFASDKRRGIKQKRWNLIPAQQYHNLLKRYMQSPEMARIPYDVVNNWFVNIIIPNALSIEYITDFAGHSGGFNIETINDVFNTEFNSYEEGFDYLESIGFYDWCQLPDGSDGWSDYGLQPLFEIINEYSPALSAEEILILINRCLDVTHCRGDLASAFIQGGSHSCDLISGNISEGLEAEIVNPEDVDLSSFNIKKQLNPKLWIDGKLDSEIRMKLLDIADDFIDFLGIDFGEPDDIIMTGSLANYNWNGKYSDIDLHILVDYNDFGDNKALVDEYFYSKKSLWNEHHKDITIHGYPVELFVQDVHEKHFSSGVYSLEKDRWVVEPDRDILTSSKVNKEFIRERISDYMNKIDKLEYIYKKVKNDSYKLEKLYNKVDKLFDKIKSERKIGFEKSGGKELNNFNIVFKGLRRNSYIEKLANLKNEIYDKLKSLN